MFYEDNSAEDSVRRVFFPSARKIVQNILQNREGFEQK